MLYAVVAPGVSGVYDNYAQVQRIMALYPYTKFRKVVNEEMGWNFIKRNQNLHNFTQLSKYGNTFDNACVKMEYFIGKESVYYNLYTRDAGELKFYHKDALISSGNNLTMVEMPNIKLNRNLISGNLIAIYHGLDIVGDFIDVDITIPNHSIFYAISSYTGSSRVINRVQKKIQERLGAVSLTLKDCNIDIEEIGDVQNE